MNTKTPSCPPAASPPEVALGCACGLYLTDPSICPRTTHNTGSTVNFRRIYGADH